MTFLNPEVWGKHYWHFLHTIAMCYPNYPNAVTKKKYYELIQNIPLFIPVENMSSDFCKLLNEYPVEPYLENKESLIRWVWFIHNKINKKLEKKQISLKQFYLDFYETYKSNDLKIQDFQKIKQKLIYMTVIVCISGTIYYLYEK